MHKIERKTAPNVFFPNFHKPPYKLATRYLGLNHIKPIQAIRVCKCIISIRIPYLWNKFITATTNFFSVENKATFC